MGFNLFIEKIRFNFFNFVQKFISIIITIITNYNLPKSDKFFFSSGIVNLNNNNFTAKDTEIYIHKNVFGDNIPWISSTKSLSGHSLGAAGVQEAIYGLIMMDEGFIAGSANIENLDEGAEPFPIVRENVSTELQSFLSNSFGFGGTNASLIFEKI